MKRNFEQFLQDQEQHIKKMQEKRDLNKLEMQKQEFKDHKKNPTINEVFNNILK